jgi:hypothetical protein
MIQWTAGRRAVASYVANFPLGKAGEALQAEFGRLLGLEMCLAKQFP